MIRALLSRLRRKPSTSARELVAAATDKAAKDGLHGFCLAAFFEPGAKDAQAVLFCNGDIAAGLTRVLQTMLMKPESKKATTMAIIAALQASGGVRVMQVLPADADCDCDICVARRSMEGRRETTSKPH